MRAWHRFWFAEADPLPVAVYRVLLGLFMLASGAFMAPRWLDWFGERGVLSLSAAMQLNAPYPRLSLLPVLPAGDLGAWALLALYMASALALTLGAFSRASAALAFLCLVTLHHRNGLIFNAADHLMRQMVFFMIFSRAGARLSLDAWWRARRGLPPVGPGPAWPQRLMQLQLSVVYLHAFMYKLAGLSWLDGSAVYYATRIDEYRGFLLPWLFDQAWFIRLATWGAMLAEGVIGALVWVRAWRPYVLALGVALHAALGLSLFLPLFGGLMVASYVVFLEKEQLTRIAAWWRGLSNRAFLRARPHVVD